LVLGLWLVACGGSGSSSGSGTGTTNPDYVGRWVGPWSSTGSFGQQQGTADLTISSTGAMDGTLDNQTLGQHGTLTGTIDTAGKVNGTYAYPGFTATGGGTLLLQQNAHLGGAIDTYAQGQKTGTVTLDLVKQ
jgi:hypothetical protein